ncbi:hypothetical protein GGD83_004977, partial [Rhodoblastus sphagnicola]|nr:hypothetical protein [Rhodoblastus sphagnicola]
MRQPDDFTQIVEFTPSMRVLIADAIEALILLLDEIDGDADLEDESDEEEIDEPCPDRGPRCRNGPGLNLWFRTVAVPRMMRNGALVSAGP